MAAGLSGSGNANDAPSRMEVYVTDVPFVRQFCRELSPTLLRAAAAFGGVRANASDGFDYCELGSGMGDTLCTLAAAHPQSRFVGVDINPEHIAFSRAMAQRGGLRNVRFIEGDLADVDRMGELSGLDFLCAHGLLSWISRDKRRAVAALARARLKPGGVLYVSYNALPGWAAVQPLRRLLHELAGPPGAVKDRAERALGAARLLRDQGAAYFRDNRAAEEMIDTMSRIGPAYVVHEYFHEHWEPLYFADLAAELSAYGLRYRASLPLYRNVDRLALPDAMSSIISAAKDPIAAETLKDYATNAFFRGDVFVQGNPPSYSLSEYLDATPFGTLVTADRLRRDIKLPHAKLTLLGEPFDTILADAVESTVTARQLAERLPQLSPDRIREALVDLLASDQIVPMASESVPTGSRGPDAHEFNLSVLAQPLSESRPVVLAAPRAGTGVSVPALQVICLRLLFLVDPGKRADWIRAFVARHPVRLHVADRAVTETDEQVRVIASEVDKFARSRLPKLEALGVVRASG